ncbi:hypothetical protein EO087_06155 [Dyella sp. M7H15-1]|uniref:immunity protein Imm33 domain-containing protein n=1 Tax=Dyella sp. M7H15-1 TaxID=2501295 RepID=UPI0010050BA3|nr:hypothetical protein [Dyella sp. M7H15-1]QAU23617.1 hypothetical protein EO087_06155 [Dyella sp. M7H15-1]
MTQSIVLDHRRLIAQCASEYDTMAHSLLSRLKALHEQGPALNPGSLIDFGWSLLQIQAHPQHWVVCEPAYDSDPITWRPEVNETLWVMQQQATLLAELNLVSGQRTRGDQWLWLQPDALTAPDVYLNRSEPSHAQDSGWYIRADTTTNQKGDSRARAIMAGTLARYKPEWLGVLALPIGCLARFEQNHLTAIFDARQQRIYSTQAKPIRLHTSETSDE